MQPKPKKLLDQVRDAIRLKNYSIRTEATYTDWIERFIRFHKLRHPLEMNVPEIEAFLTWLAVEQNVAPSTVRLSSRRSPKSGAQCVALSLPQCPQSRLN